MRGLQQVGVRAAFPNRNHFRRAQEASLRLSGSPVPEPEATPKQADSV